MGRGQRQVRARAVVVPGTCAAVARRTVSAAQSENLASVRAAAREIIASADIKILRGRDGEANARVRLDDCKTDATALVAALDPQGRKALGRLIGMARHDGNLMTPQMLLSQITYFLDTNAKRKALRYAALTGRVERLPRLDRLLLSPAALTDRRRLVTLSLALRLPSAKPAVLYDIRIVRAAGVDPQLSWQTLLICELAQAYQAGLPISGALHYADSGAGRRFCEQDEHHDEAASVTALPTRQAFGDLISL